MRLLCVTKVILLFALAVLPAGCNTFQKSNSAKDGLFGLRRSGSRQNIGENELLDPMGQRSVDRILLEDLAPQNIGTTLKSRFGEADRGKSELAYEQAQETYANAVAQLEANPNGQSHIEAFTHAARLFHKAAALAPESAIEEEALYYEGEANFFANRYVAANRAYEKLIALYSGTRFLDKVERNRFVIAEYWLELAKTEPMVKFGDSSRPTTNIAGEARRIFHRIRLDDPTGKLADDATMALGMAYFEDEKYFDAADTFGDLRMNYPGSTHQFLAHLYELKAQMKSYRGVDYDKQPLEKADEILRALVTQFPEESRAEKEYLAVEATKIRNMLAERDLRVAQYFENRGENRAAQIYYETLQENFSDTQIAQSVSGQVEKLAGLPPVPEQKAQWLIDMLDKMPDADSDKPVLTAALKERLIK